MWSDKYRSEFVTTVLLSYPCPAIFLYEEINPDGSFFYKVVDGKQRLTTLFSFVNDAFPVDDKFPVDSLRGEYFSKFSDENRLKLWRYNFAVEFIEQENESLINDIFNRINKNVARLSPQELRHAKFDGAFARAADSLAEMTARRLPENFPRIVAQSRRQMKDVENVALLMLFCEQGERSVSQLDLDAAYSRREEIWDSQADTVGSYTRAVEYLRDILNHQDASDLISSRLRNQADFYSLFAAIVELEREGNLPNPDNARLKLLNWIAILKVAEETQSGDDVDLIYLTAARSASNDPTPRRTRIDRIKVVLRT